MGDLDGILVVTVEQAVAAPYASSRLADAGARVIKVERPEGDFARYYDRLVEGASAYFVWLNRGKESICLDLADPARREVLRRIIARADVLIQNLAPGAMARLGFPFDQLRRDHPSLIICSISGYGEDGPYRHQKAYDLLVQAESGLAEINGNADAPARVGVSVCDIAAGMTAHQAILQALLARLRGDGQGRLIEVSMFHAMADWMNVPYLQYRYGGKKVRRSGLHHPTIAPYGGYVCRDGKVILIAIQNDREWRRLVRDVLGQEALAEDIRFADNSVRVLHRDILEEIVAARFGELGREESIELLEAAGIAYGRLSDLDDLVRHPQNRLIRVMSGDGPIELLAPAAVVAGRVEAYGAVPNLGEHSDAILREFG